MGHARFSVRINQIKSNQVCSILLPTCVYGGAIAAGFRQVRALGRRAGCHRQRSCTPRLLHIVIHLGQ
jgi:hypothetical protein